MDPSAARARRLALLRLAIPTVIPASLVAAASLGYSLAAIYRHDRYGSNAYDLGVFDQTLWGYSRLELVPNTVLRLPSALGDHFHPILMALSPLYWIWDDPRMLLIAQAVLLALASLPLFAWARAQLELFPAVCFQAAYLIFWGVLGGDLFDFHELAVAAPIVSLALYGLLERRTPLLLACVVLGLLTREDLALTFAAFGVYLVVVQRRWRLGLPLVAVCIGWFALLFKVVLPALAGGRAYSHWSYPALGSSPGSALKHLIVHPLDSARLFVTPATKRTALANLFVPWLLLPLLSPLLIVMVPTLAARFFSNNPSYWAQGFHYSLVLAPMLGFAAVDTTARLGRLLGGRWTGLVAPAAAVCVLGLGLYFSFGRLRPLDELNRYATPNEIAGINVCLATIPPHAGVAATSALVPHLSHRRRIYVLDDRPVPRTRFIAIDLATWIYPRTAADLGALTRRALRSGYGVRCSRQATVVLEQGATRGRMSPELRRAFAGLGVGRESGEPRLDRRQEPAVERHEPPVSELARGAPTGERPQRVEVAGAEGAPQLRARVGHESHQALLAALVRPALEIGVADAARRTAVVEQRLGRSRCIGPPLGRLIPASAEQPPAGDRTAYCGEADEREEAAAAQPRRHAVPPRNRSASRMARATIVSVGLAKPVVVKTALPAR